MSSIISSCVRKSGDTMTGDLNIGLNRLIMHNGTHGGIIKAQVGAANYLYFRNMADTGYSGFMAQDLNVRGDLAMTAAKTVDGKDVSNLLLCGRMSKSGGFQVISTGTETLVTLEDVTYQFGDGMEDADNDKMIIPVAGRYLVGGGIKYYNGVLQNKRYEVRIKNDGTVIDNNERRSVIDAEIVSVKTANVHILAVDDELTLYAYHDTGGDVNCDDERYKTYLFAALLSEIVA